MTQNREIARIGQQAEKGSVGETEKQPPNSSVHSGTVCHRHHVTRRCVGANSTGIRGRAFRAGCECANFPRYRYADCERARERRADGTCGAGRGLVSCGFSKSARA